MLPKRSSRSFQAHTLSWGTSRLSPPFVTAFNNATYIALNDWLGTKRVVTNYAGSVAQMCMNLPFGDELICSANDLSEQHFTGQIHDQETGNDYFNARYYSNGTGRFLSPDFNDHDNVSNPVPYADLENPQSLNLYAYVRNNPLSSTDSDGHGCGSWSYTSSFTGMGVTQSESGSDNSDCPDYSGLWDLLTEAANNVANTASQAAHQVVNYATAPRDPRCMATMAAGGAAAGAFAGGAVGGLGGGAGGTLVAPGVGTVGGAWAGAAAGATEGAGLGGAAGTAVGLFACSSGSSGSGGGGNTVHGGERAAERGFTQAQIDEAKKTAEETGNVTTQIGKYGTPQKIYNGTNGLTVIEETQGRNAGKIITGWWR